MLPALASLAALAAAGSTFTPLEHVFHGQRPKQVGTPRVLVRSSPTPVLQLLFCSCVPGPAPTAGACCLSNAPHTSCLPHPTHNPCRLPQFTVSNSSLSEYGVLGFELGELERVPFRHRPAFARGFFCGLEATVR